MRQKKKQNVFVISFTFCRGPPLSWRGSWDLPAAGASCCLQRLPGGGPAYLTFRTWQRHHVHSRKNTSNWLRYIPLSLAFVAYGAFLTDVLKALSDTLPFFAIVCPIHEAFSSLFVGRDLPWKIYKMQSTGTQVLWAELLSFKSTVLWKVHRKRKVTKWSFIRLRIFLKNFPGFTLLSSCNPKGINLRLRGSRRGSLPPPLSHGSSLSIVGGEEERQKARLV